MKVKAGLGRGRGVGISRGAEGFDDSVEMTGKAGVGLSAENLNENSEMRVEAVVG